MLHHKQTRWIEREGLENCEGIWRHKTQKRGAERRAGEWAAMLEYTLCLNTRTARPEYGVNTYLLPRKGGLRAQSS